MSPSGARSRLFRVGQALLAAAALALAAGAAMADEAQDVYSAGREAVFAERWADVRRTFEDFTRRFPTSAYADDAHYWLGMALYELGESERAYAVLKAMNANYPGSPWGDDGRALMIRCAEAVLKSAQPPRRASARPVAAPLMEYESFIERSTSDTSSKVQLLAIDTMLVTRPDKASVLLPRLSDTKAPSDAASMVLDRFFGADRVKVTLEDPMGGLTESNVAVLVRNGDTVTHLTLSQALDVIRPPAGSMDARFDHRVVSEIRDRLLATERQMVREGDAGSVEARAGREGEAMSAIVKVVDGEVHYYRNGSEVTRIVVLRRQAGFNDRNVKIFTETREGLRELSLEEARRIPSAAARLGLTEGTVRYLKAALAIIEIDLSGTAGN